MQTLSEHAKSILDRMEPNRVYEPQDLRVFVPDAGVDRLREIMNELWIDRQVERAGYSGWRRHRSAPPHRPHHGSRAIRAVTPEELFDHASFEDFFK